MRGWRWLHSFFAFILMGCAIYVFGSWPATSSGAELLLLGFPVVLALGGVGFGYLGTVASDEKLRQANAIMRSLFFYT